MLQSLQIFDLTAARRRFRFSSSRTRRALLLCSELSCCEDTLLGCIGGVALDADAADLEIVLSAAGQLSDLDGKVVIVSVDDAHSIVLAAVCDGDLGVLVLDVRIEIEFHLKVFTVIFRLLEPRGLKCAGYPDLAGSSAEILLVGSLDAMDREVVGHALFELLDCEGQVIAVFSVDDGRVLDALAVLYGNLGILIFDIRGEIHFNLAVALILGFLYLGGGHSGKCCRHDPHHDHDHADHCSEFILSVGFCHIILLSLTQSADMEISSGLLLIQFTDSEYQYPVSVLHVNDGCLSVSCFLVYLRYLGIIKEFLENK